MVRMDTAQHGETGTRDLRARTLTDVSEVFTKSFGRDLLHTWQIVPNVMPDPL
jgi:hypothetical protein